MTSASADILLERLRVALSGRYAIECCIGQGGMGVVFLARDERHGRRVALKVLPPDLANSIGVERFLREIRTTAQLNHPNILPLFDSGGADELIYYVMPYVMGESLAERLARDGALSTQVALSVVGQVAEALGHAHAQGIIHRDVKPGNIMLVEGGHTFVADFGLSRAMHAASSQGVTVAGTVVGSPFYMSPEQIAGSRDVDPRSDIYSLGCVLYEMLAGHPPFAGESLEAVIAGHVLEPPPPLRLHRFDVPPRIEDALHRALAKAPSERFTTAADFATALAPSRDEKSRVRSDDQQRPPRSLGRWRRLLLPAGLTATIALVAAALGLVGRFREGTETLGGGISVVALPVSISSTSGAEVEEVPGLDQLLARAIEIVPTISVREGDELLQPGRGWRSYPMQSLLTGARALQGSYLLTADITFGLEFPVTVDVFEVNSGRRVLHGLGGGGGESVSSAVQRLGLETVRTIAADREVALGSVGRLLMATQSPSALAELIEARQSFWVGETDAAIAGFQRAVDHDSTFAPAYFYLSAAFLTTPRWDPDAALGAIDSGLRYNDRMPVRWAALLAAQRLYILRDASAAIQAFHRLTADDPSFHEAWLGLGESHFHLSGYLGLGPRSSLPAFARLVDLDSTYFPSLVREHLVDAAIFAGRADAARQHAAQIPSTTERQARTATVAIKFGSTAERRAALASLSAGDLRTIAIAIYLTANQPSLMDMVAQTLVASGRPASDRRVGSRFRFAALAASSRWSEAIESWSAHDLPTEIDPWMIQAYLAGYDANEYVAPMFERASQLVEDTEPIDFFQPDALRTQGFRALVHRALMEGDSSSVTQLLEKLAGARFGSSNPEPEALRMSLHARQALLAADTLAAIAFLNLSLAHAPWSLTRYYSPLHDAGLQRILLVRLHAARGEHTEKQRWASTFGNTLAVSDVLYLAEALKALGMTAPSH